MEIKFCGNGTRGNPSEGLCDEYRLSGISSLADLAAVHRDIATDHPGCQLLFSLDDLPQARYTSGHTRQNLALADTTGLDITSLPQECFEDGAYLGYLNTKAEFAICLHNFRKLTAASSFEEACAHGLTLDDEGLQEWIAYQADPLSMLDQPVSALVVPVEDPCETLAAFPNGYFTCDLSPASNFAVARHFSRTHGYELMGMGASYLGFWRATPPDAAAIEAMASDFCALYNADDQDRQALTEAVRKAVAGRTHLWLRYVE